MVLPPARACYDLPRAAAARPGSGWQSPGPVLTWRELVGPDWARTPAGPPTGWIGSGSSTWWSAPRGRVCESSGFWGVRF